MAAIEITVLGGIDIIAKTFNAISAMMNNNEFYSLMFVAEIFGVLMCVIKYIQTHDLKVMGFWVLLFVFINAILLTPKTDVLFTDISDPTRVEKVDNVPVGVAVPFNIVTSFGYSIASFYDTFFHQPNELQYTKTGLLFGARLMDDSFYLLPSSSEMNGNLSNLMKSCIVPALQLKYNNLTWETMLKSDDLAKELQKLKSDILHVSYTKDGSTNYVTCTEGVNGFLRALDDEINRKNNDSINELLARYNLGGRARTGISPNAITSVNNYLMGSSKSAVQIYKQNILVNAMSRSLNRYPASLDGTADLIAIASEQALYKMKLSHLASYRLAGEFLPALHTVFLVLLVGIFPLMVLALFIREVAWGVVRNYLMVLGSLMLYPVLFAIFNSIVSILGANQLNGQAFTLSTMDSIKSNVATLAGAASYIMLVAIPFLSFKLFTGLGQQIASAGSYLGNALAGATSAESAAVSMGNYNWGNMQMQNINGFKTDLNQSYLSGMTTYQTASGGTVSRAEDGSIIAKTNMSHLPMNIDFARMWDSARAKATQDIMRDSQVYHSGVRNSVANTIDTAIDFLRTVNNSGSSQSAEVTELKNAAEDVIRNATSLGHKADTGASLNSSAETSTTHNKDLGIKGIVSAGIEFLGSGTKGSVSAGYSVNDMERNSVKMGSNDNMSLSIAGNLDKSDAVTKARSVSDSSLNSIQDSDVRGAASAFRDSLRTTHESFSGFTSSQAREKAISDTATLTESERLQINENLSSEFVQFVYNKLGRNAETDNILTNAHSGEYRLKREELVGQFETELVDRIKNGYANNAANVSVGQPAQHQGGFGGMGGENVHAHNRSREQLASDFEGKLNEWGMHKPNVSNVSGANRSEVKNSIEKNNTNLQNEFKHRKEGHQKHIDESVKANQQRFEDKS